jgi:copper homeostasis protein (lipoprotein)
MKNKTTIIVLTLLTFLIGCSEVPTTENTEQQGTNIESSTEIMPDNSATSLDWKGTYKGIIPCADCEGIETSLTLNEDMTYLIETKYLGKDEQIFQQKGTFAWNKEGNTILLNDNKGGPNQYFVGENMLIQLDNEGKRIAGDLAMKYVLNKDNNSNRDTATPTISETYWKLTELMGQPIEKLADQQQDTYIMLKTEGNRVQGFAGCNNIIGSYEVKEDNRITFSQMATTQKACVNMETESAFLKVLEMVDNYNINGTVLMLNKARMAPLAKFEAVQTQ